ncbi:MAG: NAD(P)-binding protein [Sorangiineae bacterium]|nr:NAD(P)-binding protein [Polyangiaceae bacterium]MEB2323041.1 NAD(P)-binding protein [Sorangiineae bacterium]
MSLSRRDALTLLLGAPLAAEACKRARTRSVPGEIRGAAMSVGHRLRDAVVERATGPARRTRTLIVGAGPSGLSAGWRLERLGEREFTVLDLEPRAGGTSAYGTDGVVPYPWGAHYVPAPTAENRALVALLRELDAFESPSRLEPRETALVRAPEERLFIDGEWHEGLFPSAGASDQDLAELAAFQREVARWVAFRDARGRRAFTLPVSHCSDDARVTALDRQSAAAWCAERGYRSERLRWYLEYACRDDYTLTLETTSAWALLFYFCARVPEPGRESEPFLTWPEGNGRLVRHLAGVLGERVKLGWLVTDVVPGAEQVEVSALEVKTGALLRFEAEQVILAVPRFLAARLLRPWREHPPAHLAEFRYGAWMVANLHLSRRPRSRGFPFAWDNVIYDSPALGYVVATHQTLADYGPTVWTYYQPFTDPDPAAARRRLAAIDHAGFCDSILSDLGRAHHGLADAVERLDVYRWGHAMVSPRPGFIWGTARRRASEPLGRVHFAHSDLSGVALFEEAQDHGVRAAEAILRARGRAFEPLVEPFG